MATPGQAFERNSIRVASDSDTAASASSLTASVYSGHTSAVNALAPFGCAARGEPLYEVGVVIGRLLRTIFLADYFVNPAFRRELLRVLNRGEATNALKRLIYTGRVVNYQAKREDEMQAVADALSLIANIVMARNTAQMQVCAADKVCGCLGLRRP